MNMKNKALILLSGGLDSYIALDIAQKQYNIILALNFNYGQKAFSEENKASLRIANIYNINLKTIDLPYLSNLCNNALTIQDNTNLNDFKQVWIPNRNGLFLNIAASYCDKYQIDKIIIGLNKEEAQNFPDNSLNFINSINNCFKYSTLVHPELIAPCSCMNKIDIVNYAIDNKLDLGLIKSCYDNIGNSNKKHCGQCMSCKLLYNAVMNSKQPELAEVLFK